jgi:hypothetical protein
VDGVDIGDDWVDEVDVDDGWMVDDATGDD